MNNIPKIGPIGGVNEIPGQSDGQPTKGMGNRFSETLNDAIREVDNVQKDSAAAQLDYVSGKDVDLHDVLIKIEEAEIAFKAMMEVRGKLVDAYREVMRLGGGG